MSSPGSRSWIQTIGDWIPRWRRPQIAIRNVPEGYVVRREDDPEIEMRIPDTSVASAPEGLRMWSSDEETQEARKAASMIETRHRVDITDMEETRVDHRAVNDRGTYVQEERLVRPTIAERTEICRDNTHMMHSTPQPRCDLDRGDHGYIQRGVYYRTSSDNAPISMNNRMIRYPYERQAERDMIDLGSGEPHRYERQTSGNNYGRNNLVHSNRPHREDLQEIEQRHNTADQYYRSADNIGDFRHEDGPLYRMPNHSYGNDDQYRANRLRTTSVRKQRDPEKFDGEKQEWVDYLKHFETVASWNGWAYEEKAMQLIMSLKGEALMVLGDLPAQVQSDYDALIVELARRYNPAEREAAWRVEFRNRMRQGNETAMQYGYALKRLALKAFPQMTLAAQEQWVMDQFSAGLGNVDLRRHVQFGHPKTLNDAISLAVEYEAFDINCKLRKPRVGEVCRFEKEEGNAYAIAQGNAYNRPHVSRENGAWDKGKIQCYYCKQLGHYKRECPKLQRITENTIPAVPGTETIGQGNY